MINLSQKEAISPSTPSPIEVVEYPYLANINGLEIQWYLTYFTISK